MTTSPASETVLAQSDPSYHRMIQVAAVNNFTGIVSMTVSSPTGIDARLIQTTSGSEISVNQVLLGQGQSLNLKIIASLSGNYSVVVTGTSGRLTHSVTVKVISRGLTFEMNPNPVGVVPYSSANAIVTATSQNGLGGDMTLVYISNNSGVGASGPTSIVVVPGGTTKFTITAFLSPTLPPDIVPPHGGSVTVGVNTPLGHSGFAVVVVPA